MPNNAFTWAEPKSLAEKGGPNELGWEAHSPVRACGPAPTISYSADGPGARQGWPEPEQRHQREHVELFKMVANLLA